MVIVNCSFIWGGAAITSLIIGKYLVVMVFCDRLRYLAFCLHKVRRD